MLQPKKTKFRKQFKGRISGAAKGGTDLNFGQFGKDPQQALRWLRASAAGRHPPAVEALKAR